MSDKIDALLAEVQLLRETTQPLDKDIVVRKAYDERDKANGERDNAIRERDEAINELAEVKAAVQWTMGKLLIRDIIMLRTEEMPTAEDGWLAGFNSEPEDTRRIAWINKYGRMRISDEHVLISLPGGIDLGEQTFPEIYNFRHFVDICRKTYRPPEIRLP